MLLACWRHISCFIKKSYVMPYRPGADKQQHLYFLNALLFVVMQPYNAPRLLSGGVWEVTIPAVLTICIKYLNEDDLGVWHARRR